MFHHQGFTLIELLVVISIIALLSGIVLVSYEGQTKRAHLSNTMQWASGIRSQLGAYTVGAWRFDGGIADDSSGHGHDGVLQGTVTWVDGVQGSQGKAASFNNGRISIPTLTETSANMTFSGWFYKTNDSWTSLAFLGKRSGNTGWMLYRNSGDPAGYFRWYIHYNNTGGGISTYSPWLSVSGMEVEKWHFITLTMTSNGITRIYLDGELNSSRSVPPASFLSWSTNNYGISIGSERANSASWNTEGAYIDDVYIYDEILPVIVIKQLYVQGLEKHNLLTKK